MTDTIETSGTVWGVFAHRFAIETDSGRVLADIGPHAARSIAIREGDRVSITGARKPSEIKVETLAFADGNRVTVDWPAKDGHEPTLDEAGATRAVQAAGFSVAGTVKRKPRHWEITASREGRMFEVHVGMDGEIRKTKNLPQAI